MRKPMIMGGYPSVCATLALSAIVVGGCGFGSGERKGSARLTVTRDYGTKKVADSRHVSVREGDSVLRMMQRRLDVKTAYGGGFINSIEGLESGYTESRRNRRDWFFYVNGVESSEGVSQVRVRPDDSVWWDYHDWSAVRRVPAVVGSYPHPFTGTGGNGRKAVRLNCAAGSKRSCNGVARQLDRLDVSYERSRPGDRTSEDAVRIVIGTWREIKTDRGTRRLAQPPASSGVFARFSQTGERSRLALYNRDGKVALQAGNGAGLVAAVKVGNDLPTWVVTGTDSRGLGRAVRLFNRESLRNRFAMAVTEKDAVPIPVESAGSQ